MSNILLGKTILVTGGTGSIGGGIVDGVLEHGASRVIVFSRDEIKHFLMKKRISDERLETVVGDVRDPRSIEQVFHRFNVDIIYHVAAMKHVVMCEEFPVEAAKTNIFGTQNVVDLAIEHGVPKMITVSTDKAANPVNVMGATKFIAERITLNANRLARDSQAFSCVRFGNVANTRGSVIPIFIEDLLHGRPLAVTDPEVTRFLIRLSDAVNLVLKATEYAQGGEIFVLKMRAFKLGDLVDVVSNRIAPRLSIPAENVKVSMTNLVTGEKLHEDLVNGIESSRLYECDGMYIVQSSKQNNGRNGNGNGNGNGHGNGHGLCVGSVSGSEDIMPMLKDEIEGFVLEYLEAMEGAAHV